MNRGLTLEIDLDSAAFNMRSAREAVGGRPVIAVVKADAYGHGAVALSRAFLDAGAHYLAVAMVSEARELREAGIKGPILVLFDGTEVPAFFELGLTPVLHDLRTAMEFSKEASRRNGTIGVHVKFDTGMGRMGFYSEEDFFRALELPGIKVTGLMSHFSEADSAGDGFTAMQLRKFQRIMEKAAALGVSAICHIANSAAVVSLPESHLDAARPGLILYGCSPFKEGHEGVPLRPLMRAKARVLALRRLKAGTPVSYSRTFVTKRDTLAAVLSVGYAEGYPRACSNRARVLINGKGAPVMGRVCMDLTVVDATDAGEVREQDEAVLLGAHPKGDFISPWELAGNASTIPYEVFTSLGGRARRIYTGGPREGK